MSNQQLDDPSFWDRFAEYEEIAHSFTARFAERALEEAALPEGAYVLDVATGTGALALAAARAGARVLATDFSPGMVSRVQSYGWPNLEARQMDGQAMDLPDASFDAAFSNFGVMLFPDWRAGLAEMARVVRRGGLGSVGTWKDPGGAAANLLLAQLCAALFPRLETPAPVAGMNELRDPDRFRAAMAAAGFSGVRIVEVTNDYLVEPAMLDDPDHLFYFSPLWKQLDADQRTAVLASIRESQRGATLPVPSTALIATALRP
jgi:ubiquinone/menaquinone biosynthesis C-methylase UbiE